MFRGVHAANSARLSGRCRHRPLRSNQRTRPYDGGGLRAGRPTHRPPIELRRAGCPHPAAPTQGITVYRTRRGGLLSRPPFNEMPAHTVRADVGIGPYGFYRQPVRRLSGPVVVPKISLRHLSRRNFDHGHSLTSLYLPLAALGSLPSSRRRTAIHLLPLQRMSGSGAKRKSIRHTQR